MRRVGRVAGRAGRTAAGCTSRRRATAARWRRSARPRTSARLRCPRGRTIRRPAAGRSPTPRCRPPETATARGRAGRPRRGARCARTRDETPTTQSRSAPPPPGQSPKCADTASSTRPASVNDMPMASDCGCGRRSVYEAHDRLQQRGGELVDQRDQADVSEVQPQRALEDRIDRRAAATAPCR